MQPKAILLLKPFGCQRARFRSQPRLILVATDTCRSLAAEGNTNIAHIDFLLQLLHEAVSRGFVNGKDGTSGKTRKRKSDNRQLEEY